MDPSRTGYLLDQHFAGALTPDEAAELSRLVIDDDAARNAFWRAADFDHLIYSALQTERTPPSGDAPGLRQRAWQSLCYIITNYTAVSLLVSGLFISSMLLGLAVWTIPLWRQAVDDSANREAAATVIVAELTGLHEAAWLEGQVAAHRGAFLSQGHAMALHAGLAEVTFYNGAVVMLEGPCEFTVDASDRGTLRRGKLTARVPTPAVGFVVRTPWAEVTDLGTEFGVVTESEDPVTVVVFEGSVEVQAKKIDGPALGNAQRLTAGQAVRLTDTWAWSPVPPTQRVQLARQMPRATGVAVLNYDGGLENGFPAFLNPEMVNATTRAWNLHGSTQTLNGVTLQSASASVDGLEITGDPAVYAAEVLNWRGDPQAEAKNDISNTGLVTTAPKSWGMKIDAVVGRRYRVQLLSNSVGGIPVRRFHVLLDGKRVGSEMVVPAHAPWAVVYTFEVIADEDGIHLQFVPSVKDHTNPYVTAVAISEPTTTSIDEDPSP